MDSMGSPWILQAPWVDTFPPIVMLSLPYIIEDTYSFL